MSVHTVNFACIFGKLGAYAPQILIKHIGQQINLKLVIFVVKGDFKSVKVPASLI